MAGSGAEWIDAVTASERLGVKPATLYAYVSRGVLQRRHGEDGRRSLFSAEEIERLARRGRPRNQPPELVIESAVTALGLDRPYYRGIDALSLATTASYETVADWLWTGDPTLWQPTGGPPRSSERIGHGTASAMESATREALAVTEAGPGKAAAGPDGSGAAAGAGPGGRGDTPGVRGEAAGVRGGAAGVRGEAAGAGRAGRRGAVGVAPGSHGDAPEPGAGGHRGPAGAAPGDHGGAAEVGPGGRGGEPEPWAGGRKGMPGREASSSAPWWYEAGEGLRAAVAAQRGLAADLLPLDRLQVITTVLGAADTLRHQLDPASVAATGRRLIAGLVDALPPLGDPQGDSIAERLWSRLCPHPATPALLTALRAALVLLADHELAASTLAARVAASAKADPYAVVLTGLGVLGGPLHGGASYGAERLLAEIAEPGQASRAVAERVRRGERVPGFGHSVYKNGDARGACLLDLVKQAAPGHERIAAGEAVLAEMRRRRLPERNIDFALATLTAVSGMVRGAGEAIFAVARTAGWLAHAMEEYDRGALLRLRASYTGPPIT